jgi:ribosomal protein S10
VGSNPTSSDFDSFIYKNLIMFFYLKISSKNKEVLKKFITCVNVLNSSTAIVKNPTKYNTKKFITILKSPHINKSAQEQFEFRFYNEKLLVCSFKPLIFILRLKKLKSASFPGIDLEVTSLIEAGSTDKITLKTLNPAYFSLKASNRIDFKKYLQLFDCYGELYLKKIV